ncbi:MAG: hypothetical protein HQM14_11685 [SAR324 cluster bacterium]|nr:hypothetical protein [SAR324 cluster bacterium]
MHFMSLFFFSIIWSGLILLSPGLITVAKGADNEVYFYNPESNVNNFTALKREFDRYLQSLGNYRFVPFNHIQFFEKHLQIDQTAKMHKNAVYLLSSWYYKNLILHYPLHAALIGTIKGKVTQKKILSAQQTISSLQLLQGTNITSAGNQDYTKNILIELMGEDKRKIVSTLQILSVPNDIDALIAVGFGLSHAALTTEYSRSIWASINPQLSQTLNTLAISKDLLLPVVAIPEKPTSGTLELLKVIERMEQEKKGLMLLQMLGLDGWKVIGKNEQLMLKQ